ILARYGDHPEAMREAGLAYAIDQIADLVAGGVEGIHLYTMNNPEIALKIADSLSFIRRV
ncbi:MAG: methylenetetrahydrofolate reductase, partial [Firmicutes bacterium]|nr:methylenetetrahydrofolate reductase [Bacillota bacterium]